MVQGPASPIATASQRARYRIGFLVPLLEGIGSVVAAAAPVVTTVATAVSGISTISRLLGGQGAQVGAKIEGMTPAGMVFPRGVLHTVGSDPRSAYALDMPSRRLDYTDIHWSPIQAPPTNVPYSGFGSGGGRGLVPTTNGGSQMSIMPYGGDGAMPLVKTVLKWLRSLAFRFGADVATGAWNQIQQLVQQGHSETTAMEIIRDDYRSGGQRAYTGKRRRMNPGNRRALRRAIRRVRSARRVYSKIKGLNRPVIHVGRGGYGRHRRRYRGDIPLYAAEDAADYIDELEDLDGYGDQAEEVYE